MNHTTPATTTTTTTTNNNNDILVSSSSSSASSTPSLTSLASSTSPSSALPLRLTTTILSTSNNAAAVSPAAGPSGSAIIIDNNNLIRNHNHHHNQSLLRHREHHQHQHFPYQRNQHQHNDFHINDSTISSNERTLRHTGMSPMIKLRRAGGDASTESYPTTDNTNTTTTPSAAWSGFNFNTPVTNSSFIHRTQPCLEQLNTSHAMAYNQHTTPWPISATSDTFSPTTGVDHIPDFNNPFAMNQVGNNGGYQVNPVLVSPGPLQHTNFPTSPPFSASSSDGHDGRQDSIQGRPHSPSFSTVAHILRRDGIRKKNARFDIPAERNLKTIDQLINSTNDESELKELKQQKRLLRNRQAALDSRQRKKQHTERLEEEKKHFSAVINDLEDALQDCKARENEFLREKEMWAVTQQQYHSHIEDIRLHQEEMVRQHTIETGDLRRKNAMLMEQLQRYESTSMSNAPSSHGISADYSDFDQMNLGTWDNNMAMAHEFTIENTQIPTNNQDQSSKAVMEAEKPAASALLLMLLLCGAWVASKGPSAGSDVLPALPDDMRAASANVLDNLYKDSGIQLEGVSSASKTSSRPTSRTVLSAIESAGAFTSNLDNLHQRLIAPSAQQLKDQAFSLTPSQYYEMTAGDARYQQAYYDHHRNTKLMGGPVQQQEDSTVAESYTRSLLRDKVSTQILKDFARMIQSNAKSPNPWKSEPM